MLDHLRLAIPVFPVYAKQLGNHYYFNDDLLELGLPCATRYVAKDENGQIVTGDIYTPYEKLPSSYTDMAFKFYHDSMFQSTHPCGVRPVSMSIYTAHKSFNPRTRVGCDKS